MPPQRGFARLDPFLTLPLPARLSEPRFAGHPNFRYRDVFKLAALFLSCLLGTCLFVWAMFWPMDPDQRAQLRLPVSIDAAKDLCRALAVFRDEHYVRCLLAHAASYLFLQAFMIPGTVFINLSRSRCRTTPDASPHWTTRKLDISPQRRSSRDPSTTLYFSPRLCTEQLAGPCSA